MSRDYYAILEITQTATETEIKKAYRKLARRYHPDVNPSEEAQAKFQEIGVAYEILIDPAKRQLVDQGIDPMDTKGAGAGFGGFPGGLGDVFEAFFGGGAGATRKRKSRVQPGEDALVSLELELKECAIGIDRQITVSTAILCDGCAGKGTTSSTGPAVCEVCQGSGEVQQVQQSFLGQVVTTKTCRNCQGMGEKIVNPCAKCGGMGRVKAQKEIKVSIPAGIQTGMRVRLAGAGEVGIGGGPAGDLYVEISEKPDIFYEREGDNLRGRLEVPLLSAILGDTVEITDIVDDSNITVKIASGIQPNQIITINGKGMPNVRSGKRGDLYLETIIKIPDHLSNEMKKVLSELKNNTPVRLLENKSNQSGLFNRIKQTFWVK